MVQCAALIAPSATTRHPHIRKDAIFNTLFNISSSTDKDMDTIYSNKTVSVTELKRNFAEIIREADDSPVAILNHNRPEAYLLPAAHY